MTDRLVIDRQTDRQTYSHAKLTCDILSQNSGYPWETEREHSTGI
jgi:hypothetical protein